MALNKDVPRLSRNAPTPVQNLIKTQRRALEGGEVVPRSSLPYYWLLTPKCVSSTSKAKCMKMWPQINDNRNSFSPPQSHTRMITCYVFPLCFIFYVRNSVQCGASAMFSLFTSREKNRLTPISTESTATDKLNNTNICFDQLEIVFSRGQTIRK